MKRGLSLLLFLLLSAHPGWSSRKVTVAQLQDLLLSLHVDKKSDIETAAALQQLELSEELTRSAMNSLAKLAPGPLTTEQMFVLEARSAQLPPPAYDLPQTPAPDEAAQKTILARAESFVAKTYALLPSLSAKKTTLRFQDNTEAIASSSGIASGAKDALTSSGTQSPGSFIHYINAAAHPVLLEHGAIKKTTAKDATRWGANGLIRIPEPDPSLPHVFKEARASTTLSWDRWENINGKAAAVFAFHVAKEQSKLEVNVCCFPEVEQAGVARFYNSTTGPILGSERGAGGGGVSGNFQTNTRWNNFKSSVPYHGRIYVDPETGIVLRLIVETELKPADVVHQLDTRIDYGPVKVGQGTYIVPISSLINSVVVPNGESGAGGYSTRTTLFSSEYSEYRPAQAN